MSDDYAIHINSVLQYHDALGIIMAVYQSHLFPGKERNILIRQKSKN